MLFNKRKDIKTPINCGKTDWVLTLDDLRGREYTVSWDDGSVDTILLYNETVILRSELSSRTLSTDLLEEDSTYRL